MKRYRQLTLEGRIYIEVWYREGKSLRYMADRLGEQRRRLWPGIKILPQQDRIIRRRGSARLAEITATERATGAASN